ncbi:MAG: hypothetical protein ABI822_01380 [Bryobacteraceae bacterium]
MPTEKTKSTKTRNLIVLVAILLLAAFLLGFIPQYQNAAQSRAESATKSQTIATLQREATLSKARDLASVLYLELTRKNYGVAEKQATNFFNHLRSMTSDAAFAPLQGGLQDILGQRDTVISGIAKSDPAVEARVRDMVLRVNQLALP